MPVYLDERFDLVSLNRPMRPKTYQAFASLGEALRYASDLATKLKGTRSVSIEKRGLWPVVRWNDPKGITALELLVVLGLTGVLLAIALPLMNPAPTAARVIANIQAAQRWDGERAAIFTYSELPPTSCPPDWTCSVRGRMPVTVTRYDAQRHASDVTRFVGYTVTVTDPQGHSTSKTR